MLQGDSSSSDLSKPEARARDLESKSGSYKPDAQASGKLPSEREALAREPESKPAARARRRLPLKAEVVMSTLLWTPELPTGNCLWQSDAPAKSTTSGDQSRPNADDPINPKLVALLARVSACSIEFGTVAARVVIPDAGALMISGGGFLDLSAAGFLDGEGTLELNSELTGGLSPREAGVPALAGNAAAREAA
jgi:hypothetical protein